MTGNKDSSQLHHPGSMSTSANPQMGIQLQAQSRPRKRRRPPARRKTVRWSPSEVDALLAGVRIHGVGKWAAILRHSHVFNGVRTSVDLKDKWRNLTSPVRAAALAASTVSVIPCSNPTSSSSAPTPLASPVNISDPSASDLQALGDSSATPATIVNIDNFVALSDNDPGHDQNSSHFEHTLNHSSPKSSSPPLCVPNSHLTSDVHTPLLNPPSESSVSPELLANAPFSNASKRSSSPPQPIKKWPSLPQTHQDPQAQLDNLESPSPQTLHTQTSVSPQQHASVQSALHRTISQSSALVEYWRTLAAHPSLYGQTPFTTPPKSMLSYLFGHDDDDDDDDDEENDNKAEQYSLPPYSFNLGYSNLAIPPSMISAAQPKPISSTSSTAHGISSETILQHQLAQTHVYNSYLAAYAASQMTQNGHPVVEQPVSTGLRPGDEVSTALNDMMLLTPLIQQQVDFQGHALNQNGDQPSAQAHTDPQMLMQVLNNIHPRNYGS